MQHLVPVFTPQTPTISYKNYTTRSAGFAEMMISIS